jgi:hypothetical protein
MKPPSRKERQAPKLIRKKFKRSADGFLRREPLFFLS